jgi:anti-sigma regulatory factor (Ser/Thr protein kinase)
MEQRFIYRPDIQQVPIIRKNLSVLKAMWKIPNSEFKQVLFIVEELFSNIIRHAFNDSGDHEIELSVKKETDHIVIEITDDGIPFDPVSYQSRSVSNPVGADEGGMGISLVRTFADGVSYRRINQKNHLQVVKWIKSSRS